MLALFIALFCSILTVQAADFEIPYERYNLANGLNVLLAPDDCAPIAYVSVWYHVGSKDEQPGRTGFAHLFEHLMFNGSLSWDDDYFQALASTGANINGSTSFDRTNYYQTIPSQHLPKVLFLESDRMGYLLDVLTQDKLDEQRDVVKNERRQRYENPPYGEAYKDLYAALYPPDHPYHHMTIGIHKDLNAASLDDVRQFFHTWYSPNNAALVVAGHFDKQATKALIEQYFGPLPAGEPVQRAAVAPVTLAKSQELRQFDRVPEQKVWIGYLSPKLYAPGDAELDLLAAILANGKDSRLYKALVQELGVATDIQVYQDSAYHSSVFTLEATAAKGHTTDQVVAAIDEVLEQVLTSKPPSTTELDAALSGFESRFYHGLRTLSGKGEQLQAYFMHTGNPGYLQADFDRYASAQPDDLVRVGHQVLGQHRVVLHIWPEAHTSTQETTP